MKGNEDVDHTVVARVEKRKKFPESGRLWRLRERDKLRILPRFLSYINEYFTWPLIETETTEGGIDYMLCPPLIEEGKGNGR